MHGKSSLINSLVGYKVAITTPKPQTTRFNIKGIVTSKTSQIIFLDTAGIHTPKNKLGTYMMEGVSKVINQVNVLIYLVDITKSKMDDSTIKILDDIIKSNKKVIFCINKIDKIAKEKILSVIKTYVDYVSKFNFEFIDIIPISVYKKEGLDILVKSIENNLDESEMLYEEDELTDMTEREIVEENIRENLLNNLDEEVPHGVNVLVESFKERENINGELVYDVIANIICLKDSHKPIIIRRKW